MKIKQLKIINQDESTEIADIGADAVNIDYNDTNVKLKLDELSNNVDTNTTNISSEIATRANSVASLQSQIRGLASGSPKGSYANAAAIVSANPDTGVYIAQDNGHIYSWVKNGSNAIDLGVYQAIELDHKIKPEETTFIKEVFNLIKTIDWTANYYWDSANNDYWAQGSNCYANTKPYSCIPGYTYDFSDSETRRFAQFTYLKDEYGQRYFLNSENPYYDTDTHVITIPENRNFLLYITVASASESIFNERQILVNSDIGSEGEKVIPGLKEPTFVTEDIYRVVNFLDLTDCVDNKYWSILDGTLMQRTGTYCSCPNHPIKLTAGMRYSFSSGLLWNASSAGMCYLASRDGSQVSAQYTLPLSEVFDVSTLSFVCPEGYIYLYPTFQQLDAINNKMFVNSNYIPSNYIPYGQDSSIHYMSNLYSETIKIEEERIPEIQLPNTIYLLDGDLFSIYYENVIKYSQEYRHKNYYIATHFIKSDNTEIKMSSSGIAQVFDYKVNLLPNRSTYPTFKIKFDIKNTYTNQTVSTKTINFIVLENTNPTNPIVTVTIGDSFTDDFGVSGCQYELFNSKIGNGINMIGTMNTSNPNAKDDAIAGWNFASYLTTKTRTQTGQVNPFYDDSKSRFNFQYYIDTYYPTTQINAVVIYLGINSIVWGDYAYQTNPDIIGQAKEMINSILAADDSIKIFLELLTPQSFEDEFLDNYGTYYEKAKYNQEMWNADLLKEFDKAEWIEAGVYLLPTNAHFDPRYSIRRKVCTTGNLLRSNTKFYNSTDNYPTIDDEYITVDIHPTKVGAQYIADVGKTYLLLAKK